MTPVRFTKMSGAGNDFVVLDEEGARGIGEDPSAWARRVCRRGWSVGADGVLIVRPEGPGRVRADFWNPDGSEAFCGNGTRCAARFAFARGYGGETMTLATVAGDVAAVVEEASVTLTLPAPRDRGWAVAEAAGTRWRGRLVEAGVPHFVVEVDDVSAAPLATIGPILRKHPMWGAPGANVNVIARTAEGIYRVRTWERGVENETLACGTGAIATGLAARLSGEGERVRVLPASGIELVVTIPGDPTRPSHALLSGDARFVFEGTLLPEG